MKSFVPVAGVDVSKRFSDLCVLSPDNNVLLRQKIYHDMVSMKLASKMCWTSLRGCSPPYSALREK